MQRKNGGGGGGDGATGMTAAEGPRQLGIFDPRPRVVGKTDRAASALAAQALTDSGKLAQQQALTLLALVRWQANHQGEAPTAHELAGHDLNLRHLYSKRLSLLVKKGYVEERPRRTCRITGYPASTWSVTTSGRSVAGRLA